MNYPPIITLILYALKISLQRCMGSSDGVAIG